MMLQVENSLNIGNDVRLQTSQHGFSGIMGSTASDIKKKKAPAKPKKSTRKKKVTRKAAVKKSKPASTTVKKKTVAKKKVAGRKKAAAKKPATRKKSPVKKASGKTAAKPAKKKGKRAAASTTVASSPAEHKGAADAAAPEDSRSLSWMAAQAASALKAVRANQTERAQTLIAKAEITPASPAKVLKEAAPPIATQAPEKQTRADTGTAIPADEVTTTRPETTTAQADAHQDKTLETSPAADKVAITQPVTALKTRAITEQGKVHEKTPDAGASEIQKPGTEEKNLSETATPQAAPEPDIAEDKSPKTEKKSGGQQSGAPEPARQTVGTDKAVPHPGNPKPPLDAGNRQMTAGKTATTASASQQPDKPAARKGAVTTTVDHKATGKQDARRPAAPEGMTENAGAAVQPAEKTGPEPVSRPADKSRPAVAAKPAEKPVSENTTPLDRPAVPAAVASKSAAPGRHPVQRFLLPAAIVLAGVLAIQAWFSDSDNEKPAVATTPVNRAQEAATPTPASKSAAEAIATVTGKPAKEPASAEIQPDNWSPTARPGWPAHSNRPQGTEAIGNSSGPAANRAPVQVPQQQAGSQPATPRPGYYSPAYGYHPQPYYQPAYSRPAYPR